MKAVTLYTTPYCGYWVRWIISRPPRRLAGGVDLLEGDAFVAQQALGRQAKGKHTVPQIFVGERRHYARKPHFLNKIGLPRA